MERRAIDTNREEGIELDIRPNRKEGWVDLRADTHTHTHTHTHTLVSERA